MRLSWNSCDPWIPNQVFNGPAPYKLVLSATGCEGGYVGHQSVIEIAPGPIPDAWRFDDAGCQTSSQLALRPNAVGKNCPTISPAYDIQNASASYVIDGHAGYARLVVGVAFEASIANPVTRYTLWQVTFDHSYSAVGPSTPEVICGGAEQPLYFSAATTFFHADGTRTEATGAERLATWNGCSDTTHSHRITATADIGGTIIPSGAVTICDDADATFTIAPETGYQVADVLVDGTSVGAVGSYTFRDVRADHIIGARFASHSESVRLSWNSCDSWIADEIFSSPGTYKLVLSATECEGQYVGHSSVIDIAPNPIPDAWRFDDAGCQTSSQLASSTNAFSKACPAMKSASGSVESSYFQIDQGTGHARLVLSCQHLGYTAASAERYTLWTIALDHAYSVPGPTTPGVDCGGVEQPLAFGVETDFWHADGVTTRATGAERHATWNGGVVRIVPITWGRVKGLYR